MKKKGSLWLLLSIVIFVGAIATLPPYYIRALSTSSAAGSFSLMRSDRALSRQISVARESILRFKITSQVEEGSMVFTVVSPTNEVVYRREGKSLQEIGSISIGPGTWECRLETDYAKNGGYYLLAQVRPR